jgi:hypothetical protein
MEGAKKKEKKRRKKRLLNGKFQSPSLSYSIIRTLGYNN